MNLIDCVESLSVKTLLKILQHHPGYSVQEEDGSQLSFLLEPGYLQGLWQQMSRAERHVLRYFLAHVRTGMLNYGQLKGIDGLTFGEAVYGLTSLRQKGIIYTHRRMYGEAAYFLPQDLRKAWLTALLPNIEDIDETTPFLHRGYNTKHHFFDQLLHLMHFIWRQPLPITQKGMIHRRSLNRLLEKVKIHWPEAEKWAIRYDGEDSFGKGFALLLDFANEQGFIREESESIRLNRKSFEKWLEKPIEIRENDLWSFLVDRVAPFFERELSLLIDWLTLIPEEKWVSLSHYANWVQRVTESELNLEEVQGFILSLEEMALLHVHTREGEWQIMRAALKEQVKLRTYLQPNLQILVPKGVSAIDRWKFLQIAELIQMDHMSIYEISRESIRWALEQGWNEEDIIHFLNESCGEIPENVYITIQSWMRMAGQIKILDVKLLEFNDGNLAEEIAGQPAFQPFILGRIGDRHLMVQRDVDLRSLLAKEGYAVIEDSSPSEQEDSTQSLSPILNAPLMVSPKVENVYPEWDDAFPGIHSIPKSWLREQRSYHLSSLIDMLSKAIQYHMKISFTLHSGQAFHSVSPIGLEQLGGSYSLCIRNDHEANAEKVWISLQEIERIQAHLPFQNEADCS
jgi:hypothetical protein